MRKAFPRWLPQGMAALLAIVLLLLGVLVVLQMDRSFRTEQADRARTQAEILAASITAAVDFRDHEAANEAVSALRVSSDVRVAAIYDKQGRLFAGYAKTGEALPPSLALAGEPHPGEIVARAPVTRGGDTIGQVVLLNEAESVTRRLARYALISVLAILASLIVAVLGFSQAALRRANRQLQDSNAELIRQIAEREKAESQLRQAQKMESIGQLTGGIAHDFNNMLAIVIGNLDIAERRFRSNPDRAQTAIGHALEGANRAASLTRRLLAFARRQPLQPQPIDVNQLVSGMSELLRRTLGEGVVIETVLAGGLWKTHADPGQLESAILNLCVNARDAMDGRGRLTIETLNAHLDDGYALANEDVAAGQYVAVAISDNGPGMPPEVLERAFEPFFTTKGVGKGTGLGLSQVYGFAKQSGGHAKIYTEAGEGTTIKIYLPRFYGAAEIARGEAGLGTETPRGRPEELVLVVEDEEQVRRMSVETLGELGYGVLEANGGEEALRLLAEYPGIRLLFTDVVMPDMNGRQLADKARALRPDLPVLYTTGYTRNAVVHNGVVDSDVAFIPKPFTVDQLARKLRTIFETVEEPSA